MYKERFCTCPTLHCRKINSETYLLVSLAGLMHTLSLVRGPVTWIVIEAGGVSNSTAQFLAQARVHNVVHLGYPTLMPVAFEARWILESHLRVEGLRWSNQPWLHFIALKQLVRVTNNVHSDDRADTWGRSSWRVWSSLPTTAMCITSNPLTPRRRWNG